MLSQLLLGNLAGLYPRKPGTTSWVGRASERGQVSVLPYTMPSMADLMRTPPPSGHGYLYALTGADGIERYIGKTTTTLGKRRREHLKGPTSIVTGAWFEVLRQHGEQLLMRHLDTPRLGTRTGQLNEREQQEIDQRRHAGEPLLNFGHWEALAVMYEAYGHRQTAARVRRVAAAPGWWPYSDERCTLREYLLNARSRMREAHDAWEELLADPLMGQSAYTVEGRWKEERRLARDRATLMDLPRMLAIYQQNEERWNRTEWCRWFEAARWARPSLFADALTPLETGAVILRSPWPQPPAYEGEPTLRQARKVLRSLGRDPKQPNALL